LLTAIFGVNIPKAVPVVVVFTEKINTMNYYQGSPDNSNDIPKVPFFTRFVGYSRVGATRKSK
jgi:hypothetical protein